MCEINAHCPNCGQPDLDDDETNCVTIEWVTYREYLCSKCGSLINVQAPKLDENAGKIWRLGTPRL